MHTGRNGAILDQLNSSPRQYFEPLERTCVGFNRQRENSSSDLAPELLFISLLNSMDLVDLQPDDESVNQYYDKLNNYYNFDETHGGTVQAAFQHLLFTVSFLLRQILNVNMCHFFNTLLLITLLMPTTEALSQDFEDIDKLPVKVIESCNGNISSRFCYHVKERLRESERFKIVNERARPAIGLNLLTMDVMESSMVYSTSITIRKVNSQEEIEMMVNSAEDLSSISRKEMRKRAREEVRSSYVTSSIGTCASGNCKDQSVNVESFLDNSIDKTKSNSLKINIIYYKKRKGD